MRWRVTSLTYQSATAPTVEGRSWLKSIMANIPGSYPWPGQQICTAKTVNSCCSLECEWMIHGKLAVCPQAAASLGQSNIQSSRKRWVSECCQSKCRLLCIFDEQAGMSVMVWEGGADPGTDAKHLHEDQHWIHLTIPHREQLKASHAFHALESIHKCPRHTSACNEDRVQEARLLVTEEQVRKLRIKRKGLLCKWAKVAWVSSQENGGKLSHVDLFFMFCFP